MPANYSTLFNILIVDILKQVKISFYDNKNEEPKLLLDYSKNYWFKFNVRLGFNFLMFIC